MSYEQTPMQGCAPRSGLDLFHCLRENAPLLNEDEVRGRECQTPVIECH